MKKQSTFYNKFAKAKNGIENNVKKHIKSISKVFVALLLTISLCTVIGINKSHADAGYHSSYSGGSSHSSSSHSSSSHSSSSYRSSSSSSRKSSSSSSSSSGDSASAIVGLVIFIIIIVIVCASSKKGGNTPMYSTKLQNNAKAINKLKSLIPEFNEKQFLDNGYKIFLDVEDAWMNFNLEKVRNSITDEMFNMYESQLSSMEVKGEQNIMSGFKLKDCAISNCVEQNNNLEVTAKYIIEFYDYIIDKASGKVLRGSKTTKLRMYYDFTFIMKKTDEKIENCPNCGAPVEVNSADICKYCGSKIVGENTSWVMSKKVCTRQTNA